MGNATGAGSGQGPSAHSTSVQRLQGLIANFSWAFLGLAFIRIWIQCDLYATYEFSDAGFTSVLINLVRVAFTALLVLLVLELGFPRLCRKVLSWLSITTMTLASVLFFINLQMGNETVTYVASVCAGLGIVWGSGMWMGFYLRLQARGALLYTLLSLALGSLGGLLLGFLDAGTGYLISMIMPTISFLTYQRSMQLVEQRGPSYGKLDPPPLDTVYATEPKRSFVRLLAGLALFEFVLGITRGFPFGESIALSPLFQVIHQMGVVLLCLGGIWYVLLRGRFIRSATLWRFEVILVAASIMFLATMDSLGLTVGATLSAVANTLVLSLLWYTCYDVSRHMKTSPYAVLGICWVVFLLARELGRWGILLFAPKNAFVTLLIALMVCLLAISIAVLLGGDVPRRRQLFDDLALEEAALAANEHVPQSTAPGSANPASRTLKQQQLPPQPVDLVAVYGLTARESEVVGMLVDGKSKAAIGEKLFISENTVRGYVKNAYAKMDVHDKHELADRYWGRQ